MGTERANLQHSHQWRPQGTARARDGGEGSDQSLLTTAHAKRTRLRATIRRFAAAPKGGRLPGDARLDKGRRARSSALVGLAHRRALGRPPDQVHALARRDVDGGLHPRPRRPAPLQHDARPGIGRGRAH